MKGTCEKTRSIQRLKIGYRQRSFSVLIAAWAGLLWLLPGSSLLRAQPVLVDHTCTNIKLIPESAILAAKLNLHIAYGHTSHGSQLTDGMTALVGFMNGLGYPNNLYAWNDGGTGGALDLHDYAMDGDVGYYPDWVNNTHSYLGAVNSTTGRGSTNPDVNVIVWSWCGQAAGYTAQNMIDYYLTPMNALESEYWGMKFVYMTCHLDGSGVDGNLNQRNNQIRQYCQNNNKILYDFADIESYDPDGLVNYMPLGATDNCDYDSDGNGTTESNWAIAWQNSHTLNVDWFDCSAAHTQPLNGNRKAYAAWWLWARLAGWDSGSATLTLTSPNGGENWNSGTIHNIIWSSGGTIANVNIDYSANNGSSWTSVAAGTANDGTYAWTVPPITPSANCLVRISDASNAATNDVSDSVFSISSAATETVSTPSQPSGANSGLKATSYPFTTGGSTSNLGHSIQYKFDWDDGSDSGWLAVGTTQAAHSWSAAGTYDVRAMACCASDTAIESPWSSTYPVIIYDGDAAGAYNSPAQYKVLPEVIWSSATGGGTWMSNVQVTDVSGGSQVSVYYNAASGRRGPFLLWDNSAGGALSSVKYTNLLETIDGLDSETFTYYGTVGAVEFITQDGSHLLQAAARTLNGSYAKTFTALSLHDANTADSSRAMIVANLSNNVTYRSTGGFFNPTSDAVTVEFTLLDGSGGQIGSQFNKTLAGHDFQAFNPFIQAGVPYPGSSYDNVILRVRPTTGAGQVMCFGATVDNTSNDPAAHVAVQGATGYDNGPGSQQILPEVIWSSATGGGTWMSNVQVTDVSGGSQVSVYYNAASGRRGPFLLWDNSAGGALSSVKYANLLETIDGLDTEVFTYYGTVGAVEFVSQDGSHLLQAAARTLNGSYAKTLSALNLVDAETADTSRVMLIQNYTNNAGYRSTCGFYNPTADAVTVEFTLLNSSGAQIGSQFSKTLAGHDFQAFNPFIQAGVPYPGNAYDNIILRVRPTSGAGSVMCFGATVDNTSNDPAAHLAVQAQ